MIYDLETSQNALVLKAQGDDGESQNRINSTPSVGDVSTVTVTMSSKENKLCLKR